MKKFKFSLDSVLSYKQQVLDALKGEHAAILAQVREQEGVLEAVWQDYRDCNEEYRQRKMEGLTVTDAMLYQNGLRALEREIERETAKLEELGFTVTMDKAGEVFSGNCGNLTAIREGELDGALFLSSHMDRMPNGFGIKPVERDGVLCSDGTTILAADDISGVCAILEGLRCTIGSGRPLPRLEVVFTIQEELCLGGAKVMDPSVLKAHVGYIFDSPGGAGRFINGAPGRYILRTSSSP